MNRSRIHTINQCIEELSFVALTSPFELEGIFLKGEVEISFEELQTPLSFEVEIYPQYPFRFRDEETIKFVNKHLLKYGHVMGNGMICIHTSHSINLKDKLLMDFNSLKNWTEKYYINKDDDTHYEHLITSQDVFKNSKYAFMFTNVDHTFKKDEYGFVDLSPLNDGISNGITIQNYIIQRFTNRQGVAPKFSNWSSHYKTLPYVSQGVYVYIEKPPATHDRFIMMNWGNLNTLLKQGFIEFLHSHHKSRINKQQEGYVMPLFIGYKILKDEIHWQVALLEVGKFPIKGIKENKINATKIIPRKINWGITKNASYEYFFGRGAFSEKITNKKILIIGTGAIGSIVARTLVKGGCLKIGLCDYDVKEPENVCRAEFQFINGLIDKVEELKISLSQISPFVEVGSVNQPYFDIVSKALFDKPEARQKLENFLNSYDIVFDCTTDNDLMYILNQLKLSCDVINMSITNKAKEFVCAFYPNMYGFVTKQVEELIEQDTEDMHNPTGCWSPTFKASYNDINVLVQYALKHINVCYEHDLSKNNFVIETGSETEYKLELKEF